VIAGACPAAYRDYKDHSQRIAISCARFYQARSAKVVCNGSPTEVLQIVEPCWATFVGPLIASRSPFVVLTWHTIALECFGFVWNLRKSRGHWSFFYQHCNFGGSIFPLTHRDLLSSDLVVQDALAEASQLWHEIHDENGFSAVMGYPREFKVALEKGPWKYL
jgi:hypothetical protein